jgi:diguanylate cyclase (GGDEF)-like protein/PAS domain S-box-containing protein
MQRIAPRLLDSPFLVALPFGEIPLTVKHKRPPVRRADFLGKEYFENLFNEVPEAIVIANNTGRVMRINAEFSRMFGYDRQEAAGHMVDDLIAPENRFMEAMAITDCVAHGQKIARESVRRRKDGSPIQVSILGVPIITHDQQVAVYGLYRDISDRKQAEADLQLEKAYLEQLVETAAEGIVMLDVQGQIILHNSEFCRMFGFSAGEVLGRPIDDLIQGPESRAEGFRLTGVVMAGGRFAMDAKRRRKDGSSIDVSVVASPIVINGARVACYAIYRDISDIKQAQEEILESQRQVLQANAALQERTRQLEAVNAQLERISNYDGLTAIPNRRYFEHFYELEWRRAWREKKWITLIMIDVDFFKAYNDRNGHLAGDECLKRIAQSLQLVNRASDLVSRYGGEEFVAVLSGTDLDGARLIAERMRQRVHDLKLAHGGSTVGPHVTVSMGIAAQIPEAASTPGELLLKADQALYLAKSSGRDQIQEWQS